MSHLLDLLANRVLVSDGGMGSMIHQLAQKPFRIPDEVNRVEPELVLQIHERFLKAGADVIETNTYGCNRFKLGQVGLADQVANLCGRAVKLAREARDLSGKNAVIAGSVGPSGLHADALRSERATLMAAFRETALALEDRGVDAFILETFSHIDELAWAVEAVRGASKLPVIAQIALPAFDAWSDEPDHDAATDLLLHRLAALDADVTGFNCSIGPDQILPFARRLVPLCGERAVSLQPNSGLPRREGGRFLYPQSYPMWWRDFATQAIEAGVRLIGGCCGTTPTEIAAIASAVEAHASIHKPEPVRHAPPTTPPLPPRPTPQDTSTFAQRLASGAFTVSVQLDPPKGTHIEHILEAVHAFKASGQVHAVDVNSNPMARLHMDALWLSAKIEAEGMETIAHYTPRDASLMGIQGNLLGAWNAGIRNLLVITGDPSVVGGEPGVTDVNHTDAIGMVHAIRRLNQGYDHLNNVIGHPPNFTLGVAVNPNHEQIDYEVERFKRKVDAGADFAMTQVFFEWSCWERFVERFGGKLPIPVLVAIWPLTSHRLALRLHHEVPGIVVPDHVLQALQDAGPEARTVGFEHARTMLAEARSRVEGAYIIAPFKRPVAALELLENPVPVAD